MSESAAPAISLPREHGGGIILLGVAVAAAAVAPDPFAATGLVLILGAAFFAHTPLERLAVGQPLRRGDPLVLVLLAVVSIVAAWLAARVHFGFAGAAGVAAAGILAGAIWARRTRLHRSALFEAVAMSGLGASAGLAVLCGGGSVRIAAVVGVVLGAHAGLSVPVVRGALRKRRKALPRGPLVTAALFVIPAVAAAAAILLGAPLVALALAPRTIQLARLPRGPATPAAAGLLETGILAAVVAIVVLAI